MERDFDDVLKSWSDRPVEVPLVDIADRVMDQLHVQPYSMVSDRWTQATLGALATIAAGTMLMAWPAWSAASDPTVRILIEMIHSFVG